MGGFSAMDSIIGPAAIFHRPSKRSALHGRKRAEAAEQDPEQAMNRSRTGPSRPNASHRPPAKRELVLALTGTPLRAVPPLPATGRGETESGRWSAPPRPAFGRGGRGVRACLPITEWPSADRSE